MLYPIMCGANCNFTGTLVVTGSAAGPFTFDFHAPYFYVVDAGTSGAGVLKIYDMSDPENPILKSTTSLAAQSAPQNPRYLAGMLFIPYRGTGTQTERRVTIWDVDDPENPVQIGQTDNMDGPTGRPWDVEVVGTDLFCANLASTSYLQKFDISDPTSPVADGSVANPGGRTAVSVRAFGNRLFFGGISSGSSGQAYIVSTDTSLSVLDTLFNGVNDTGSSEVVIHSDGIHLYTSEVNGNILWTVDISDPANLATFSRVVMTQTGLSTAQTGSICLVESVKRVFVGRPNGASLCIPIMDITNKDTPVVSGSISTSGETVTDICNLTQGCPSMAWGQGTGAAIHLRGTVPLS